MIDKFDEVLMKRSIFLIFFKTYTSEDSFASKVKNLEHIVVYKLSWFVWRMILKPHKVFLILPLTYKLMRSIISQRRANVSSEFHPSSKNLFREHASMFCLWGIIRRRSFGTQRSRYLAWLERTHVPASGGANGSRDVLCFMWVVQLPVTDTPATQYSN